MSAAHITALIPLDLDVSRGVICPACGCRRLLCDRVARTPAGTIRERRCDSCGHRLMTAERVDSPAGGSPACPHCPCVRLRSANVHHRLDHTLRYRTCTACGTRVRTREVVLPARPTRPSARPVRPCPFAAKPPPPVAITTAG